MSSIDDQTAVTITIGRLPGGASDGREVADTAPIFGSTATIGRYVVLDQLGKGGMGTVYAAYDSKLDRRVALKLLRASASQSEGKRLEREAMALAKLSHPNIVHVYDTGVHQDHVFIAMELVDGEPLKRWMEREPRPDWRAVLRAYLQAARGVAAAHEQGLIHLDIKPSNILVGNDGRVRVADFGLARMHDHDSDEPVETQPISVEGYLSALSTSSSGRLYERLTATGAMKGTPIYMAPECLQGTPGLAADQYSFCVSLYADLYGRLPFATEQPGFDIVRLTEHKVRGAIEARPPESEVPPWLHAVVVRGLAPDPQERYSSMNALIAALQDDPTKRRRARVRLAAFVAMSMIAAAALSMLLWTMAREDKVCQGLERELHPVWNGEIKSQIRTAFGNSGLPYAADTSDRVSASLDEYARSWLAMRAEACEATHLEARQPEDVMYLRIACLDRRRAQLGELAKLFATSADSDVVNKAVSAIQSLPPINNCGNIDMLRAAIPLPEDPQSRSRIEALQSRIDRLEALHLTGKYNQGVKESEAILAEVADLDHPPVVARAMYWLGVLKEEAGTLVGIEEIFHSAIQLAAEAKDDALVSRAWARLVRHVAEAQRKPKRALVYFAALSAAMKRTDDQLARASSLQSMGYVLEGLGRYPEAEQSYREALAILETVLGPDHLEVAMLIQQLAVTAGDLGRYEKAVAGYRRSAAIFEKTLGTEHPDLAIVLNNLAYTLVYLGKHDSAVDYYQQALDISKKVSEPDHPDLMYVLAGLGRALAHSERIEEAEPLTRRALTILENAGGRDHPDLAWPLLVLGELHLIREEPAQSVVALQRALALDNRIYHAEIQLTLAQAVVASGGDLQRATELAGEARDYYQHIGNQPMLARASRWLSEHQATARRAGSKLSVGGSL